MSEEAVAEEVVEETVEETSVVEEAVEETVVETEAPASDKAFTDTFVESLQDDGLKGNKVWDRLKGKSADELGQYITELVSYNGKKGDIPGDDADEGAWNEFYTKMGRPETIDGYDFAIGNDFKEVSGEENLPYYQTMVDGFKDQAFKMGLPESKASEMVEWYLDKVAGDITSVTEISSKQQAENIATIDKEWGDSKPEIEGAMHAMLTKAGADTEALKASGVLNDPNLAIALGKLASDLADDPEIGHHMTKSVTGLHDQLNDTNDKIMGFMSKGDKVPEHILKKRTDLMAKLGDNL